MQFPAHPFDNKLFLILPSLLTSYFCLLKLGAAPFNSTSADFDIPSHPCDWGLFTHPSGTLATVTEWTTALPTSYSGHPSISISTNSLDTFKKKAPSSPQNMASFVRYALERRADDSNETWTDDDNDDVYWWYSKVSTVHALVCSRSAC